MIKSFKAFINENKVVFDYMSDAIRADYIQDFLDELESDPTFNEESPEYDWLMDPHDGYPKQTYIQSNDDEIIYWEGWSSYCWDAAYQKAEYKNLSKEEIIESIIKNRFTKIGDEFDFKIKDWDYFWYDSEDDDSESGYIMKVIFTK